MIFFSLMGWFPFGGQGNPEAGKQEDQGVVHCIADVIQVKNFSGEEFYF